MNNEDKVKEIEKLADKKVGEVLEDFPGLQGEMHDVASLLAVTIRDMTMKEIVFRSLMTGATLMSDRYKSAQKVSEGVISELRKEKT